MGREKVGESWEERGEMREIMKTKRKGESGEKAIIAAGLCLNYDYYVLQFLGCFCPSLVPHSIHLVGSFPGEAADMIF